jgi:hypothetical protein
MMKNLFAGFFVGFITSMAFAIAQIIFISDDLLALPFSVCGALPSGILGSMFGYLSGEILAYFEKQKGALLWSSMAGFISAIIMLPFEFIFLTTIPAWIIAPIQMLFGK